RQGRCDAADERPARWLQGRQAQSSLTHGGGTMIASHDCSRGRNRKTASLSALMLLVFGTLVAVRPLAAQNATDPDSSRVIALDPLVVTITHLETLRSRLPNAVSVLSRAQIRESGAASVLQVVNE